MFFSISSYVCIFGFVILIVFGKSLFFFFLLFTFFVFIVYTNLSKDISSTFMEKETKKRKEFFVNLIWAFAFIWVCAYVIFLSFFLFCKRTGLLFFSDFLTIDIIFEIFLKTHMTFKEFKHMSAKKENVCKKVSIFVASICNFLSKIPLKSLS